MDKKLSDYYPEIVRCGKQHIIMAIPPSAGAADNYILFAEIGKLRHYLAPRTDIAMLQSFRQTRLELLIEDDKQNLDKFSSILKFPASTDYCEINMLRFLRANYPLISLPDHTKETSDVINKWRTLRTASAYTIPILPTEENVLYVPQAHIPLPKSNAEPLRLNFNNDKILCAIFDNMGAEYLPLIVPPDYVQPLQKQIGSNNHPPQICNNVPYSITVA